MENLERNYAILYDQAIRYFVWLHLELRDLDSMENLG